MGKHLKFAGYFDSAKHIKCFRNFHLIQLDVINRMVYSILELTLKSLNFDLFLLLFAHRDYSLSGDLLNPFPPLRHLRLIR